MRFLTAIRLQLLLVATRQTVAFWSSCHVMDDRSSWVAFLKKESFACALSAHVHPSLHVVPVGVRLCRRLPLVHDTRLKVLRRRVTPQSMRERV